MHDGRFYAKEVSVQITFTGPVTNLPGEADVEVIFSDGVQNCAVVVGTGGFQVSSQVHCFSGYPDLVYLFPGPAEVRAAGLDHSYQGVDVPLFVLVIQIVGNRVIQGGAFSQPLGTAEAGFNGTFVLINGIETEDDVSQKKIDVPQIS